MQKNRPIRLSLINAQGKKSTLNSGPHAFVRLDGEGISEEHIVLGLGPMLDADDLSLPNAELLDARAKVYYVECAEFSTAIKEQGGQQNIPSHWQSISKAELLPLLQGRSLWWYRQNMQFYPNFWADIWGMVQAWILRGARAVKASKSIMVAGNEQLLLHKELCTAFDALGFKVHGVQDNLHSILANEQPSLFFSVNLRGLDRDGADFALLKSLNIPVALWFVDNPWHILSTLRLPWWREATLFVTDASFITELKKHGAKSVYHLPLAVSQHMWDAQSLATSKASQAAEQANCIFVGRASFPDNAGFFAAAHVEENILNEAFSMLKEGERPHFHWWQKYLGADAWPSHAVRSVGLGAEQCAREQRIMWLKALLAVNPIIFGDSDAWKTYLPDADEHIFYPSLDYYNELAKVYAAAKCVLNVTSLLLPAGLTQRHFDVWAAGGFLFTDITQGLDIFPKELTKDIGIKHAHELESRIKSLGSTQRCELINAWQELLRTEHGYMQRMGFVLDVI